MGKRKITHTMVAVSSSTDGHNWSEGVSEDIEISSLVQEHGETAVATFANGVCYSLEELEELTDSVRMVSESLTGVR